MTKEKIVRCKCGYSVFWKYWEMEVKLYESEDCVRDDFVGGESIEYKCAKCGKRLEDY